MKNFKVALQLYSVREDMDLNVEATLKKVKEIGYDYVEFAGFYNFPANKMRELLDKYALTCVSVHQGYEVFLTDETASVEYLKTIGAKYCAIPWMDKAKHAGTPAFVSTVKEITQVGKLLKKEDIQLVYHNHDFEFETFEDKFLLDCLYEAVPADFLQTEIDTCWVCYAGYDPAAYVRKYTGRSPIVHLKDFKCANFNGGPVYALIDNSGKAKKQSREASGFEFKPLGHGIQNIPSILAAAEDAGADIVVVEQDRSLSRPAMEAAKMSRDYLLSLGI
ncbi:MAG TPA: sugar phosphate isomerase/epimerase [Clostridiaceae bacterium]